MRQQHLAILVLLSGAVLACATTSSTNVSGGPAPSGTGGGALDNDSTARQVVNRLTFGARPSDLADVKRLGVKQWLELQLHPERIPDPVADSVLGLLDITNKSVFELYADHPQANEYGYLQGKLPDTAEIRRKAEGDSVSPRLDRAALDAQLAQATRLLKELPLLGQRRNNAAREIGPSVVVRASASDRQLLEVMTVFWENHFSVAAEQMPNPFSLVDYDRVIRAHALGKFRDLLGAVATTPAMLVYLDNYQSSVDSAHMTDLEWQLEQRRRAHPPLGDTMLVHTVQRRRPGLNENYARELMELHTLGVDGGYTQQDVQEVARCLTGWGIGSKPLFAAFAFNPAVHDAGEKTVLGVHIPGGRGIEDGEQVLDLLARHPSTAHFIAKKLVIHFVSDDPPPALVERAAQVFLRTDGDIREVLKTIVLSPEFNSRAAYRAKVKTPFELVASILRVMHAAPDTTQRTVQLIGRLGQPVFGRPTPDGWPDQGAAWMNAGALLNRVNLGAQAGANQIPNATIARWIAAQQLSNMSTDNMANIVANAVLAGDASPATRDALASVRQPAARATEEQRMGYIGTLLGVAIGSSDFQRR